jgi:hypothetical protein
VSPIWWNIDGLKKKNQSLPTDETVKSGGIMADIIRRAIAVCRVFIGDYQVSIDGYKCFTVVHKVSIDGYKCFIAVYKVSIAGYKDFIDGYKSSIDGYSGLMVDYKNLVDGYQTRRKYAGQ